MSKVSAQHVVTGDGVKLAYERHGVKGPVVVFIHGSTHSCVCKPRRTDQHVDQMRFCLGWSGSRRYFDCNAEVRLRVASFEAASAYDRTTLFAGCRENLPGISV